MDGPKEVYSATAWCVSGDMLTTSSVAATKIAMKYRRGQWTEKVTEYRVENQPWNSRKKWRCRYFKDQDAAEALAMEWTQAEYEKALKAERKSYGDTFNPDDYHISEARDGYYTH